MFRTTPRRPLLFAVLAAFATIIGVLSFAAPAQAVQSPRLTTTVTVSCSPATVEAGKSTTCTAFVNGSATGRPRGIVNFYSSRQSGFASSGCSLVLNTAPGAPVNQSTCSQTYTPTGAGFATRKDTITAQYPLQSSGTVGDPLAPTFRAGSGQTQVSVPAAGSSKKTPNIVLNCPDPIPAGSPGTCSVTLESKEFATTPPSGTVTFKSSRPKGMNSGNSTCTLVLSFPGGAGAPPSSSCGMTYIPPDIGYSTRVDTITATYEGDETYGKVTATDSFGVPKAGAA
jgi:hypothetical protein